MRTLRTRVQLAVFALATVVSIAYGSMAYLGAGHLVRRPYVVEVDLASSGGIYPRADVEMLGAPVGTVAAVEPGPSGTTRVVLHIDHGTRIPASVHAAIAAKSAIGEQVVELTPRTAGGPVLAAGATIPLSRTTTPVPTEKLLADLDGLAASLPTKDLSTTLTELSTALQGTGPDLARTIEDASRVTQESAEHAAATARLIRQARTVLDTQADLSAPVSSGLADSGAVLQRLATLSSTLADITTKGASAAEQTQRLVGTLEPLLKPFLTSVDTVLGVGQHRASALRKTLVLLPWSLQTAGMTVRYCDRYDASTGRPVTSTCHYDAQGRPLYHSYFAMQLPELPGNPQYLPCTKGYEATTKYLPNGEALDGSGQEDTTAAPNLGVQCTASPTDPLTPDVRGPQNVR